jgi:Tol biopolymer transport system component
MRNGILRALIVLTGLCLVPACGGGGGGGGAGSQALVRVSTTSTGALSNGNSDQPSISSTGRYVVFRSLATNLWDGGTDNNGFTDIYRKDLATKVVDLVSVSSTGGLANGNSRKPSISADGRYVAFASEANNLVTTVATTLGRSNIYLRDMQTGTTTILTVDATTPTTEAGDASGNPVISENGLYVTYDSLAQNLVTGYTYPAAVSNVYRKQIGGATILCSFASGTTAGELASVQPDISANGSYVAFSSSAETLVGGDNNGTSDTFVYFGGTVFRVSVNDAGAQATGAVLGSSDAVISGDGQIVIFLSDATNLTADVDATPRDIFARTWLAGSPQTIKISHHPTTTGSGNSCDDPDCDTSGTLVAWHSASTELVDNDTNGAFRDVFYKDALFGTIMIASTNSSGAQGNMSSGSAGSHPSVTPDGLFVAFDSDATNLVGGDTNGVKDIFRKGPY